MVDGQDELWHGGGGHCFDEAGAGPDDTGMLGFGAHHEARHVLNEQQRRRMAVAVLDKIRRLFGGFGINDPAEPRWCSGLPLGHAAGVCNNTDENSADPGRAADHLLCKIGLEFIDAASIKERVEDLVHVVWRAVVFGEKFVERV